MGCTRHLQESQSVSQKSGNMGILVSGADDEISSCVVKKLKVLGYHCSEQRAPDAETIVDEHVIFLAGVAPSTALDYCRKVRARKISHNPIVVLVTRELDMVDELIAAGLDDLIKFDGSQEDCNTRVKFLMQRAEARELRWETEYALSRSTALASAVLETTVDGIATINSEGILQSVNSAIEKIFGYRADEMIGQNVSMLMPEPFHGEHDAYIQNYLETGHRKIIGIGREVIGRRKDGSVFPLDLAVSEVRVGSERIFTGVLRDISERRRLEQEVLRITDSERLRIGQDLHDGLGQMLTGIGLISQNLASRVRDVDKEIAGQISEISGLVKEADQQARTLARNLSPVDVSADGLESALSRLTLNIEKLFSIRCRYESDGRIRVDDNTTATHLYRIAQEAISNAVAHGKATVVRLELSQGSQTLRLRVIDNGTGFVETGDSDSLRGMGIHIMNYRARMIGGNLEITNSFDGGAIVTCTVRLDMIAGQRS